MLKILFSGLLSTSKKTKTSLTSFNELHYYLDRALAVTNDEEMYESFDILGRWKSQKNSYYVLCNMARDILTLLVSIIASEFAFTTGGRVLTKRKSSIVASTLDVCIYLKDWLDAEKRNQGRANDPEMESSPNDD